MSKHSKEPWRVEDDGVFVEVMSGDRTVLPAIRKAEAEADFRRIVACVNRLAGFTTEEIEAGIDIAALKQQRAALAMEDESV